MQQLSRKARKLLKKERKAAEKLEMKKALKHGVIGVLVFFSIIIFSVAASAVEVTYYDKSNQLPYNDQHQFIWLEFRDNVSGYGIANYKNSYHENSLMVSYSRYWQPYRHIELNLSASADTGGALTLSISGEL